MIIDGLSWELVGFHRTVDDLIGSSGGIRVNTQNEVTIAGGEVLLKYSFSDEWSTTLSVTVTDADASASSQQIPDIPELTGKLLVAYSPVNSSFGVNGSLMYVGDVYSDNGGYGGIGREGFNGPWRGSIFTSYEGAFRVPFLIRWPGKIPARRVSNEIVHAMDVYATLAGMLELDLPSDRIMDSADHSDFLMGKSETSARESIVYYVGTEIYGAKWRNWKMLYKEIERIGEPVITNTPPTYYNLLKDPQEQVRLRHYIQDSWIATPFSRVLAEHRASLEKDPGTPDP